MQMRKLRLKREAATCPRLPSKQTPETGFGLLLKLFPSPFYYRTESSSAMTGKGLTVRIPEGHLLVFSAGRQTQPPPG